MITATSHAVTTPEGLLAGLRWRYATKKFDPSRKIPKPAWEALEEALVLSPSSYGLQPWAFFVVEDGALRARLKEASWGQSQIVDADKLVVFAVKDVVGAEDIERLVARIAQVRGVPVASLDAYKKMMMGVAARPETDRAAWAARQVYIALGVFLSGAAALGIDACPMEGIEPAKYDEILGLRKLGYRALCVATAGYRAADDAYASQAKVRFPREEVVRRL